jgi:hypothetical protein
MKNACLVAILALALGSCEGMATKPGSSGPAAPSSSAAAVTAPQTMPAKVAVSPLVDSVMPGDDAAERAHNQKGEADETGDWSDRTYRHAQNGWFSWDFKVVPNQANDLVITYWGSDQRTFDIQVDGEKLVSEQIRNDHPDEFFEKVHTIPATMVGDKQKITVKFVNPTSYAGGVFGVKIMRPGASTQPAAKTP